LRAAEFGGAGRKPRKAGALLGAAPPPSMPSSWTATIAGVTAGATKG